MSFSASGPTRSAGSPMQAGATGLIFGRNIWQREHGESLKFAVRLREVLDEHPR